MRAKGWMLWAIYSWGIVEEHREWEERGENQRRNSIKNKVNSGRKAERLEMKKSTSRRERNPCTWWRQRKMSPRRRDSIMSEWDGKSNKGRKERQPSNGHIRKSSHQQWGFLLQSGALIVASQLCHCRPAGPRCDLIRLVWWFCMTAELIGLELLWNPQLPGNALSQTASHDLFFLVRRG